jgi:thymidine kinase
MALHVVVGPMFSGKTSSLLRSLLTESAVHDPRRILYVNHVWDNRSVEVSCQGVTSHNPSFSGNIPFSVVRVSSLDDVDATGYDVIGVDEIQFFNDIEHTIRRWKDQGKVVYVVGLDGSDLQELFGEAHLLLAIADTFKKIHARCRECASEGRRHVLAPFTNSRRTDKGGVLVEGAQVYYAVCWKHTKTP